MPARTASRPRPPAKGTAAARAQPRSGRPAAGSRAGTTRSGAKAPAAKPARSRSAPKRTPSRRAPAKRGSQRRRSAPRRRSRPLLARAAVASWMGVAHGLGALARHAGGAADLEPAHRRDGAGLFALAAAIVVAVGAWFDAAGPVGHGITVALRDLIGCAVLALPAVLLVVAWQLLRRPSDGAPKGRWVVGWVALCAGVLGLLDLANGDPISLTGRRNAGGVLGVLAGSPTKAALSDDVAIPILVLVGVFGLLVLTATPLHAVSSRLRAVLPGADGEPIDLDDPDEWLEPEPP